MSELRERLAALDTCLISDALDSLGLAGAVAGVLPVWEGGRLAGRVVPMRTVPAEGRSAPRHLGTAALELAEPGDIVVVEQAEAGTVPVSATWGGLLALTASLREVGGIVVDGACRDVDEIRELRLPVSARAVVPFTARGRYIEDTVGEPIVFAGVPVNPGDWVAADASGVVFVPSARIGEVLDIAERLVAKERLMAEALRRGDAPSAVLGRNYEEMLDGE
ncbi:RraA family protein [Streptomyces sp. NPDC001315]|uniref:RraA family protein n=1 Tax=Streptomyces sp. NPDC001315 TaxID=3364562 RepID=UPI00369E5927